MLAVPRADGTVRLLSVPALEEIRMLRGRDAPAAVARFRTDGARVIVGGVGGSVHVWDVTSGRLNGMPLATGGRFAFGFFDPADPDRMFTVAADGANGSVVLWDRRDPDHPVRVGQPYPFDVERGAGAIPAAAISSDGSVLAAGTSVGGSTATFDVRTQTLLHMIPGALGGFVPGTHTLATAESTQIVLSDAVTGLPDGGALSGFEFAVGAVSFAPDATRVAALDGDRGIRVFDLASRSQVGMPLGLDPRDIPVGFLADGRLVTSGADALGIWRVGVSEPPFAVGLRGGYQPTDYVRGNFVPGTDGVITENWNYEEPLLWDASTGALRGAVVHDGARNYFSVSPDGKFLAAPTADHFGIWSLANKERVATFDDGPPIGILAFWSPTGDMVATGAVNERSVVLWDVSDPRRPVRLRELVLEDDALGFPDVVVHPYWSHDGRLLAAVDYQLNEVTVFEVGSGRQLWSSHPLGRAVGQVAFSPDGDTLGVVSWDENLSTVLTLWEIGDWDQSRSVVLPGSAGSGVEFLRGGDVLVTTSEVGSGAAFGRTDGSSGAQLWDTATLEPIGQPLLLDANGRSGYVDRDAPGDRAVIGGGGGTLLVWDLDVRHWKDTACNIAGRNLTRAEWAQYLPGDPYHATCPQWPAAA
jgi:WD40 repeat protein